MAVSCVFYNVLRGRRPRSECIVSVHDCFRSLSKGREIVMIVLAVFSYKICQGRCTLPEKHDEMNLSQKTGHDTSEAPSPAPKVLVKRVIPFPP